MNVQRSITGLLACVLVLSFATVAQARERNYWRYHEGHFENTSGNQWEEHMEDKTFHFTEVDRTEKFVELYDKSRNITVRLYDDRQEDRSGIGQFHELRKGEWR